MKKLISACVLAAAAIAITLPVAAREIAAQARTTDGRTVTLFQDGTWQYADEQTAQNAAPVGGAGKQVEDPRRMVRIAFDSSKWMQLPNPQRLSPSASLAFIHSSGEAYAMAIVERIPMALETLKRAALQNARVAAPDAKIVLDEMRMVGDKQAALVGIEGNVDGIVFRYHSLYWSGDAGAVQVITFTSRNLFQEYEADFNAFLSGVSLLQ